MLQANKLTININKTHCMVFHRVRLKPTKDGMIGIKVLNV